MCCLILWARNVPESPRNRPDVGNIFMQCLHLLRRYFVPLPWRFLTQPELQQGSDRLKCNQKHFLVLHAIKLIVYTSMRSDSELEHWATFRPSIYRHSHQANSVFGGRKFRAGGPKFRAGAPKFRASGPKFCTSSLICTSSKFWLVHLGDDVRDASRR